MKIKHSELIEAFQMLMTALSKSDYYSQSEYEEMKEFDFSLYDFYWTASFEARYDLENNPKMGLGSIDHDIERIIQCIADNEPMAHHFRCLGDILIAIADTIEYRICQGKSIGLWWNSDD